MSFDGDGDDFSQWVLVVPGCWTSSGFFCRLKDERKYVVASGCV